jgi:hypothetical protein
MPKARRSYGWNPDRPDQRDLLFAAAEILRALPAAVDLRRAVYDQGPLGSCTANAIGAAVQFDLMKQKGKPFVPSRLFLYYNERRMEGTTESDDGAALRDGIKSMARDGDCPEGLWPYDVGKFTVKPPDACYKEALRHQALKCQRVGRDLGQMRGCLAAGYPFAFGFTVYESSEVGGEGLLHAAVRVSVEREPVGRLLDDPGDGLRGNIVSEYNWFPLLISWRSSPNPRRCGRVRAARPGPGRPTRAAAGA